MQECFDAVTGETCDAYEQLGAVCLRGVFTDWIEILFHFRTVHGARGNLQNRRRRAFSMRWVGDDGHYTERPGRTSPPYSGHGMVEGQRLREDWFPVLWPRSKAT